MLERRHIRVLVPYSRTLFYNDKGRERGITAETARAFEQYLNKKYAAQLGKRPITLYLVPTTRDELLEDVAKGLGDIAAGNLTVTDARKQIGRLRRAARRQAEPRDRAQRAEVGAAWPRPRRCRARPCTCAGPPATTTAWWR